MAIIGLVSTATASAQFLSGSVGAVVDPLDVSTSSFTATSFSLNLTNLISHEETGSFLGLVPPNGDLTAFTGVLAGLSSTPTAESINNFLVFSTPDSTLGSSGTTPGNRFDFDLSSLTETSYTGQTASFTGFGTLIDTEGGYSPTPASFDLAFSSQGGYSLTIDAEGAVPEPSTWALLLSGAGLLAFWQKRRVRRA